MTWADDEWGRGPAGVAIRTTEPAVFRNVAEDPRFLPWRDEAVQRGYASALGLPLLSEAETFGALTIWSAEPDAFGPDEVDLLSELSTDLGFGIFTLRARAERATLAAAVEQSADSIVMTDPAGTIWYVNPAFERRSGYRRADVAGRRATGLHRQGADRASLQAMTATVTKGQPWKGTFTNRSRDGGTYVEETVVAPLTGRQGRLAGFVYTGRDVTRERELEGEIARKAREQAELAARLGRLRLLETPEATAEALVEEIARVPGMDFAALARFAPGGALVPLALRVPPDAPVAVGQPVPASRAAYLSERAAAGPWVESWIVRPEDRDYGVRMAATGLRAVAYAPIHGARSLIGIMTMGTSSPAVAERIGEHLPTLLSVAAVAGALLRPAHEQADEEAAARARIEAIIAGEAFTPVFQPVVELRGRTVVGYEALTRFADGVPPATRFAEAATLGLGPALELACLRRAHAASRALPTGAWLGLNVSPALLTSGSGVAAALRSTRRAIFLEVTEHAAVADYGALRDAVAGLGPRVRLAVDDAGAGYAGLQHIVGLSPAIVKLDIGLIRGIDADPARQALVAGMAYFASRAGCRLVAEGVETEATAAVLLPLGVALAQGYLFGRPQPIGSPNAEAPRQVPGGRWRSRAAVPEAEARLA